MKQIYGKKFKLVADDNHQTYLEIHSDGSFTLGELYHREDGTGYHCLLNVRHMDVKKALEILNNPKNWEFPE